MTEVYNRFTHNNAPAGLSSIEELIVAHKNYKAGLPNMREVSKEQAIEIFQKYPVYHKDQGKLKFIMLGKELPTEGQYFVSEDWFNRVGSNL